MRNKTKPYLILSLYALCLMLFCAGSSPLVDGMGTDSSVFFTIGRGMAQGKIPYVDLFDHKGWYLYLFNCFGAWLGWGTTWGLFLVETVFMAVNGVLFYEIAGQLPRKSSWKYAGMLVSGLMLMLTLNFITYQGGNLVESYSLTFQLISIWLVVKYLRQGSCEHPPAYMLIHGICAGIVMGIRANMTAMWGALGIVILCVLLWEKQYKNAFWNMLAGVAGVSAGLAPMVGYGLVTGSLSEMFHQMVLFNLMYTSRGSLWKNLIHMPGNLKALPFLAGSLLSFWVVLRAKEISRTARILYGTALLFSVMSTALSGRDYGHYYEYLIPFLLPTVLVLEPWLENWFKKRKKTAPVLLFLLTVGVNFLIPARILGVTNTQRNLEAANHMAQIYREKYADRTSMLVVNNKAAFYNKFGLLPGNRFFYLPAVDRALFPDGVEDQKKSLLKGENEILIISYRNAADRQIFPGEEANGEILRFLDENYEKVCEKNKIEMYIKKRNQQE